MTQKTSVRQRERAISMAYMALGLVIAVLPFALQALGLEIGASGAAAGVITGAIVALVGVRGFLLGGQPRGDERTSKLGAYAASWSWFAAICVVCSLFLGDYYGVFEVSAAQALTMVLASMLGTIVLFNVYYRARGDVE